MCQDGYAHIETANYQSTCTDPRARSDDGNDNTGEFLLF